MVDRENREDWKRERSLLSLGQAVRGEEEPSPVSIGDRADQSWHGDAASRHRLARSRREARSDSSLPESAEIDMAQAGFEPASSHYAQTMPGAESSTAETRRAPESHRTDETGAPYGEGDNQQWKPLIDPMLVGRGIAKSKPLIVTTTILGAALGIAIALSMPKKYEATTELVIEPGDLKLSDRDLTQPVGQPDAALAVVETRIKMLTSGTVLDQVVKNLNLVDDPEFNGQGSGGLGVMSLVRSILSRNDGPGGADEVRRQALAVGNLARSLSVERSGKTFVISISATTQNGEKSALIANTTRTVFQQEAAKYQSDMAGRATTELTSKLDDLRKGVEAAERNVEDFRATHGLVDAQGHLISDDQMLKLNEQLSVARARTLELNARAASARSLDVNSVLNGTLPEEINSNTMSDLRSQYATLKQEADRAAVRLGPRHPEFQALSAQLDGARERIAGELRRIASSLQVDLKRAVQLEQDLASRLAQAKVQSGDVNSDLVSLRELEREAAAKRSVYEQYLLRAKETGEQTGINTTNINVITSAQPPLEPNGPSRAVVALAGLLLGFASGLGLGAMRGAYESLRETATSRSRRGAGMDKRQPPFEDKAYQAAPPVAAPQRLASAPAVPTPPPAGPTPPAAPMPPAAPTPPPAPPPVAQATAPEGPDRLGSLMSMLRKAVSRKPDAEDSSDTLSSDWVLPSVASSARTPENQAYPGYPEPNARFAPQQPSAFPPPPFQPGASAPYPQPPLPPHMMPRSGPYSGPQPYPYGQPIAYPQAPPWQMPPQAGYPYPQPMPAPQAGQVPYQPQPTPPAYPQPAASHSPLAQAPQVAEATEPQAPIEEIRASLREFREAVRELTENRARRRYF
ncbi:MAG: Wzz/FepE/Etk N-terminal domain-containing protein [Mesorhizobium sp.]